MRIGKKAILFDRDGVLNIDSGYVYRYENIRWIDGAREAVARLTEEGWLLFVVTNQSGVARGFYTEKDVMKLHKQMNKEFRKYGGPIPFPVGLLPVNGKQPVSVGQYNAVSGIYMGRGTGNRYRLAPGASAVSCDGHKRADFPVPGLRSVRLHK